MMSAAWVVGKEYHQSGSRCLGMAAKVAGGRMPANAKKGGHARLEKNAVARGALTTHGEAPPSAAIPVGARPDIVIWA